LLYAQDSDFVGQSIISEEAVMKRIIVGLFVLVSSWPGLWPAAADTFIFSDSTYDDANWIVPQSFSLISAHQVSTGGNPGSYREVQLAVGQNIPNVSNLNTTFTFNPSASGKITGITYAIDLITTNAEGASYFPLIQQNGVLYIDAAQGAGMNATSNTWLHHVAVLNPADFTRLDSQPGSPNFVDGSAITFGYEVFAGGAGFFVSVTGIDNDPITVTFTPSASTVPEPGTLALASLALLFLAFRRARGSAEPSS